MRAFIDESVLTVERDLAYVIVGTIPLEEADSVIKTVTSQVVGNRKRPFHWSDEGPQARSRMIEGLIELGAVAHVVVHHPTGRRRQESARQATLRILIPQLVVDGATELLIESRSTDKDVEDRSTIVGTLKDIDRLEVSYDWGDKTRYELWLADGVCGAVGDFLSKKNDSWYRQLQAADVLTEIEYIQGA